MAPSDKHKDRGKRKASKESEGDETLPLNLWVGSLSSDTVDSDLMKIFKDYGAMDALTSYTPTTFAFVLFRTHEEAQKAMDELQRKVVNGNPIRIEFAQTAKPGKHLWVGGVSPSVTKEQLENELLQYGELEDYKFMRGRNSALVGYYKLDDAIAAQKNINGKILGGLEVRADFQKPRYPKRDLHDHHNVRGRRSMVPHDAWIAPEEVRNFLDNQGSRKQPPHGDGPPSNILWVGYPSSVHISDEMLHRAMILFGEIKRIRSFPSRNYSFVEFRSIDEARRAKEGLQGCLFGDPRIRIMYSNSEFEHGKDTAPIFPGYIGPTPDIRNQVPFGHSPMAPNNFSGHFRPNRPRMGMLMRPYSAQGFDTRQGDSEFDGFGGSIPRFPDGNRNAPDWVGPSPAPGPSSFGVRTPYRTVQGECDDGFDARNPKRSRADELPTDAPFHGRRVGGEVIQHLFGLPHPERVVPPQTHSPIVCRPSHPHESPDTDLYWRGVIAKGGSPVCRARCVPIGKALESPLPAVVNCFARTDLDRLTKHYGEAIGFDIVFFVPNSEEDFAGYTEFLQYLGLKNRVGVAKCDDGTTLFLVPPSDFLTEVLKVSCSERLYGVVLKLPNRSTEVQQSQEAGGHSKQHREMPLENGYDSLPRNGRPALRMDYINQFRDNFVPHSGIGVSQNSEHYKMPSTTYDCVRNPGDAPKVEIPLSPEIIATLASILPHNNQSIITGSNSMPTISSSTSSLPSNSTNIPLESGQGLIQDCQTTFSSSQLAPTSDMQQQQQFGSQFSVQLPLIPQYPNASNLSNGLDSVQPGIGSGQVQGLASNMQQIPSIPTCQTDSYTLSKGLPFMTQSNQYYQLNSAFDAHNAYRAPQAPASIPMFNQPVQQQQPPATQGLNANMLQNHMNTTAEHSAQDQQLKMVSNTSGEGTSREDAEKNQRYQKTLAFAASLIEKIKQQGGNYTVGGSSGSQQ